MRLDFKFSTLCFTVEFVDKYETCTHTKVLKKILCGFDIQNNIDASQFTVSEIIHDNQVRNSYTSNKSSIYALLIFPCYPSNLSKLLVVAQVPLLEQSSPNQSPMYVC